MDTIVNKVAESGIISLDLAKFLPADGSVVPFDIKPFLFREMILKEKDFRESMKNHDWGQYSGKHVAVHCSVDAVVPVWAYMLVASGLEPFSQSVYFGSTEELGRKLIADNIALMDTGDYADNFDINGTT